MFHKQKSQPQTGGAYTKGVTSTPQSKNNSVSTTDTGVKNQSADTSPKNLAAPTGTFVNVYRAKIDEQLGSTCNTNPGATCQIIFKNGSVTKSLALKTTDGGGAAYWAWKPNDKDVGLTPGIWHIEVKATMGSQTQTTNNDPLTLEVYQ